MEQNQSSDHSKERNIIHTKIWYEQPEPNNPFATRSAHCHGYDVYGEMLGRARWVEMLYLLFHAEAPLTDQADLLEILAVALANPGPRDASVHAAMAAGVGGSTAAASLIAALSVGAGQFSGGREIYLVLENWAECGVDLSAWQTCLQRYPQNSVQANQKIASEKKDGDMHGNMWPEPEHAPGFDSYGVTTTQIVKQTLACLARYSFAHKLQWLEKNLTELEHAAQHPLALSGVAATALADLGFSKEQGEIIYLLLRLPGAAAHALEQQKLGYKKFPFGEIELQSTDGL